MSILSSTSQPSQDNLPAHDFTPEEVNRLAGYNSAVQAGIYNELLDSKHALAQEEVVFLYGGTGPSGSELRITVARIDRDKNQATLIIEPSGPVVPALTTEPSNPPSPVGGEACLEPGWGPDGTAPDGTRCFAAEPPSF